MLPKKASPHDLICLSLIFRIFILLQFSQAKNEIESIAFMIGLCYIELKKFHGAAKAALEQEENLI